LLCLGESLAGFSIGGIEMVICDDHQTLRGIKYA
jgi:hypothetical protein